MRRGISVIFGSIAVLVLLAAPASAIGPVEVGNRCEANEGATNLTVIQIAGAAGGLPAEMPFAGVVTAWTVNPGPVNEIEGTNVAQSLRIVRPTTASGTTQYTTVGESATELPHSGPNTFLTRIPVHAGDHVGLYGNEENQVSICETGKPEDLMGQLAGNAPLGTTHPFEGLPKLQPAVAVTLEPDIDGDGFGDATQDKCLAAPGATSGSSKASLATTATVAIPKLKLGSHQKPARTVALSATPASTEGGRLEYLELSFPKSLRMALAALPTRRALPLNVTVSATDPLGRVTTGNASVRLRGQRRRSPSPGRAQPR